MFFSKFFSGSRNEPDAAHRSASAPDDTAGGTPGSASAEASGGSPSGGTAPGAGSDADSGQSAERSAGQTAERPTHDRGGFGGLGDLLGEQERKYVLAYIVIGIVLVEFLVAIVAIWQGVANVQSMPDGTVRFRFPWGGYLVSVAAAPVVVLLVLQVIALGYTRLIKGDPVLTEAQLRQLPPWLQKMLAAVNGVPTFLLLLGVTLLATVIYYFDKVLGFVIRLGESTEHLVLWVGGGMLAAWCVGYLGRMLFAYKVRRMQEEYAYRREVLERTGMIIVDQRSMLAQLPGQDDAMMPRALPGTIDVSPSGGGQATGVLPPAPGAQATVMQDVQPVPPATPVGPAEYVVEDASPDVPSGPDVPGVLDTVDEADTPVATYTPGAADAPHVATPHDAPIPAPAAPATEPASAASEPEGEAIEPEGEAIEPGLHEPSPRKAAPQPIPLPLSHPPDESAPAPKKPRVRKKPAE
ncbi:hypothetical protein [Nitratidesulfovibrio liaohensis]|uniref:Uncharacterized protein n=1 Tax=Nitratidesulfovibrio liaohensis TaxID=2604158 RepID=A0ABY9R4M8_9BACT|nr:hypothetical protein [Nitratidesulfovibrio liaohensis]WMW65973.1 hypothetical protein KPS_000509 [Nitratidesulfovibrio liaohensis]